MIFRLKNYLQHKEYIKIYRYCRNSVHLWKLVLLDIR